MSELSFVDITIIKAILRARQQTLAIHTRNPNQEESYEKPAPTWTNPHASANTSYQKKRHRCLWRLRVICARMNYSSIIFVKPN